MHIIEEKKTKILKKKKKNIYINRTEAPEKWSREPI